MASAVTDALNPSGSVTNTLTGVPLSSSVVAQNGGNLHAVPTGETVFEHYFGKNGQTNYMPNGNDMSTYQVLGDIDNYISQVSGLSQQNSALSQLYAREQMDFQREQNALAMKFNADEAQKSRNWQALMSSTAHQREVRDLLAAGLNPILSANAGASTPSGATASGVTSAGASGQVDTNASGAAASFLSTLMNAAVAMRGQSLSAQTALAQTVTAANASKEVARIGFEGTKYHTDETNKVQREAIAAGVQNSLINAGAILGSASASAAATRYASDNLLSGTMYSSDNALRGVMYGADKGYSGTVYGADSASARAEDSPQTMWGMVNKWLDNLIGAVQNKDWVPDTSYNTSRYK